MIELLPPEKWNELEKLFDERFDAVLPDADKAHILVKTENGEIKGGVVAETLLRIGQFFSITQDAMMHRQLLRHLRVSIPKGTSVVVFSSDGRFDSLCEKFGMTEVKGKIYRLEL